MLPDPLPQCRDDCGTRQRGMPYTHKLDISWLLYLTAARAIVVQLSCRPMSSHLIALHIRPVKVGVQDAS